jgi:glycosyltransferase involved in cell wall biosynthesis
MDLSESVSIAAGPCSRSEVLKGNALNSGSQMKIAAHAPVVSVIMSMHNSALTVEPAVRSILQQTFSDWELIVIDNGSSDLSGAIVAGFDDPRIRLVREENSTVLAVRLNQAVGLSRGEFIARMDADDICFPGRLCQQVAKLRRDPELDLVGCRAVVFTSKGELLGELPVGRSHDEIIARPVFGFPFPHPTWCGRAGWFRNNPYDSSLGYAEDQDLLLRSCRHTRFGAVDAVLLAYRQDRLALRKLLPGRATFVSSLWRLGRARGEVFPVLAGVANHVIKAAVDIATVGSGLNRLMQLQRLDKVSPAITAQWSELQDGLLASSGGTRQIGPYASSAPECRMSGPLAPK